jgi:hypothetical protein
MNDQPINSRVDSLEELRESLSSQFIAAAVAGRTRSPWFKRRWTSLVVFAALAVPASLALAGEFSGEETSFSWDGETLRMNGEVLECPVDESVVTEAGFDPCLIFSPAPAPLDAGDGASIEGSDESQVEPDVAPQQGTLKESK